MRGALALLGALGALACPVLAAEPEPGFPASVEPVALAAWLAEHTRLKPETVAVAGPVQAVAVEVVDPQRRPLRVIAAGEVLDPAWASAHRQLSWEASFEVDCARGLVRSPKAVTYAGRRQSGRATQVEGPLQWVEPAPDDPTRQLMRAVCDRDFRWPLVPSPAVATAEPVPAPPAGAAGVRVQVVSSPFRAEAEAVLAKAKRALAGQAPAASASVEVATVKGVTRYRGVLRGFADLAAARGACAAVVAAGLDCLVWQGR